ncbi:MAG: hypothetical protein ACI4GC_01940, partial [Acutalibacteraceae bacterium]
MKNKTKTAKKLLALVLSLLMIVTAVPLTVIPVSAATKTVNRSYVDFGVVRGGSSARLSGTTFNIVNDGEADNTSAGIIKFDISGFDRVTDVKLNAVAEACLGDERDTGYYYSYNVDSAYLGGASHQVSGSYGGWYVGRNTLLTALNITVDSANASNSNGKPVTNLIGEIGGTDTSQHQFDITDAVNTALSNGNDYIYIVIAKTEAGSTGSDGGWTDTNVNAASQTITITGETPPDTSADITSLANAINIYEARIRDFGATTYYTNLAAAFEAYNNAKRYYDAVTYGGYVGDSASTYATALNDAVNAMGVEGEFMNYCSTTVYANSLKSETVSGATNLIYYGADPSVGFDRAWAANGNGYNWAKLYFRFDIPNFVLGLDGTTTAKAPIQIYYFNSGFDATQYFTKISETTGKFIIPQFTISNTAFSTGIGTTALNQSGNWALNNPASGKYFAGNEGNVGANGTTYVNTTSYMVHQASSYLTTNNSTIGLTAANNSQQISYTLLAQRSNNFSATYTSKSDNATNNDIGYGYVVYMTDYNANYNNWKNIIPYLTYYNYNGYVYTDGYNAASNLDQAANISLAQNNFAEHGDMSTAVNDWADRIQSAAEYQIAAKNTATTKVTTYYMDLKTAITNAKSIFEAGQKCYTDASWSAFTTAYDNARAHMAALSPDGTNNQYSTSNTDIYNLATALDTARTGLALKATTESCHIWTETARTPATCEVDGSVSYVCDVCAQTKTETLPALGHSWSDWSSVDGTDNHTRTCSVCSKTETSAHAWGDGVVTTPATCTTDGLRTYTCPDCNATKTETINATGHNWSAWSKVDDTNHTRTCSVCSVTETAAHSFNAGVVTTDPTCTAAGEKTYTCFVCNGTKTEIVNATGHTLTSVAEAPATCGTDGVKAHYECSVCGAKFMDADGNTAATTELLKIPATGNHTLTYTSNGEANHTVTCSVCSYTDTVAHTWNDGEVITDPTCTATGEKLYTCTACGQTKTEVVPVAEHTPVSANNAVDATCTTAGKESDTICSVCGVTVTTGAAIPALGHDFTEQLVDADHLRSAANCQNAATYWYDCSRCDAKSTDKYFSNGGKDASNHTGSFRNITGQPATCYQTGWTDYQICDGCNQAVGYTILNKTAHTFEETVSNDNGTHSQTCSVCRDANRPVYVYTADCTYTWVVDTDADCGNIGTKHQECTTCGYVLPGSETEIPATGEHNYNVVVTAPTCTTDGYTTHTCTVCGNAYTDTVVPATGHDWAESATFNWADDASSCTATVNCSRCGDNEVTATVVQTGSTTATCTVAGTTTYTATANVTKPDKTYTDTKTITGSIDADAHSFTKYDKDNTFTWTDGVDGAAPTAKINLVCAHNSEHKSTADAVVAYKDTTAGDCITLSKKNYTATYNLNGEIITSDVYSVDDVYGPHNYGTLIAKVDATCTTDGTIAHYTCSICKKNFDSDKNEVNDLTIDALGHDIVNHDAKAPTCTEIGWDAYETCSRCDYTTYAEKDALGHDIVNHDAKAPTCTEIGWDAYETCSRCDYTTYAEKDALGHDIVNHDAKAPTCTEKGWDAYETCSRCDYTTYAEKDALGHDIVNHDAKAPTCTEIGWDAYETCS